MPRDPASPATLSYRGTLLPFGRWMLGEPVGASEFVRSPPLTPPQDDAGKLSQLDFKVAQQANTMKPRHAFDAWQEIVGAVDGFIREEAALQSRGYSGAALVETITKPADYALDVIGTRAGTLHGYAQWADQQRGKLAETIGDDAEEDSTRQTLLDLSIAQIFRGLDLADRMQWVHNEADPRTVAAIVRLPRAVTGLRAEELQTIKAAHVARSFPQAAAHLETLDEAIAPGRSAAWAALQVLSRSTGKPPADLAQPWGKAGTWVLSAHHAEWRSIDG